MNEFVIRNHPAFGEIRLVAVNGEYHAVLSDIVQALGNQRNSNVTRNCKSVIKYPIPTNGGTQMMNVIPFKDVQRIIIKSRMPVAEQFEEWAEQELLPFMQGC
ncbi:Bro-N domain-containing protein [Bacillus thuringiensis]|uniref:BRO-N domain-containing protein n=1 Tax=Bacillus thuringiensis TaxID=1428 RepID=UPI0030006FFD